MAIASRGSLIWTDVEDTRDATGLHRGGVSFAGDEQPSTSALRRKRGPAAILVGDSSRSHSARCPSRGNQLQTRPPVSSQITFANGAAALNLTQSNSS